VQIHALSSTNRIVCVGNVQTLRTLRALVAHLDAEGAGAVRPQPPVKEKSSAEKE
jgi:hypothetical protein